VYKSVST